MLQVIKSAFPPFLSACALVFCTSAAFAEDGETSPSPSSQMSQAVIGCISSAIENKDIQEISAVGGQNLLLSCQGAGARQLYSALTASHPEGDYNTSGYLGKITNSRTALCIHILEHNGQGKDGVLCRITIAVSK
jgi:hypothetical protein